MPYIQNQLSEEEKKKQQEAQNGINISGQSTSFNQSQNNQPQVPKPQAKSGSWVNLNQYLDANKENATQMGQNIANKVADNATQAKSSLESFKSQAPGVVNQVNTDNYFANPDANKKSEYATMKNTGGYSGPDSVDKVTGYSDTQSKVKKADEQVNALNSESGRFNLLQDTYNRPQYSQGMKKLDNVLLQKNDESKQAMNQVNEKFKGILDLFNTESTNMGNQINSNIQTAAQNKNAILAAEAKAKNDLINPIQARANQLNQSNPELINRINSDLSDDTLSDETLGLLGLSSGQNLYDLNLNSYVNPNYTQVGLDNAATAEERAKYAALASMIDDPTMTQITSEGKAIKPVSFNKEQFDKDFGAKQAEYNKALQDYRTPSTSIKAGNGTVAYLGNQTIAELEQIKSNNGGKLAPELQAILDNFYNTYQPNRKVTRGLA